VSRPELLRHDPEGNRNPYESTAWSRSPLTPTTDDVVHLGVTVAGPVDGVEVQWRDNSEIRTTALKPDETARVWSGTIGPFPASTSYRFVTGDSESTEWFDLPVLQWTEGPFIGLDVSPGDLMAFAGNGVALRLTEIGDAMDWTVEPATGRNGAALHGRLGRCSTEVTDGELLLRCNDTALTLVSLDIGTIDGDPTHVRLAWRLHDNEALFGTGERFDRVDQRGLHPDIRVYEQYKHQGTRTYFPVPWILSTAGYGLHVYSPQRTRFDLGAATGDIASVTIPDASNAAGRWHFGPPSNLVRAYTQEVGRPKPLPLWAYGPWMSGNEWDRDARVRQVVERTIGEDIPATVLVIEAWSDETTFYLFNDTDYDPVPGADPVPADRMHHGGRWPDPRGLVDWLHGRGLRVLLWQIPVLKDVAGHPQHDADVAHAEEAGLCVTTNDETTYRNQGWWFPGARIIDFTNPDARHWWFTKRAYLLDDIGVDGFKTDGGEHLWGSDVVTFAGETGDAAANRYPVHYERSYHEFLADHGHDQPLTFSRAGFTGAQAYPAHWAGDEDSTWQAFQASLTAGISAGLSGIAHWGWDLAGFSGPLPTAELYKRATAMAAFSPIMQYHSEHNEHRTPLADRTPWNVAERTNDPDVLDVYRFYARLRMNLIPYLNRLGVEASETGMPLMRALAFAYPDDDVAVGIDDQYLLGADLLVAPVTAPDVRQREVYLPAGDWRDLWTAAPVPSGWNTVEAPVDTIPAFVPAGAAIGMWMTDLELGSAAGLPGTELGRSVVMIIPGTRTTRLIDPTTNTPWRLDSVLDGDRLHLTTHHAPSPTTLWVRPGPGRPDRTSQIREGDATIIIDLAA